MNCESNQSPQQDFNFYVMSLPISKNNNITLENLPLIIEDIDPHLYNFKKNDPDGFNGYCLEVDSQLCKVDEKKDNIVISLKLLKYLTKYSKYLSFCTNLETGAIIRFV